MPFLSLLQLSAPFYPPPEQNVKTDQVREEEVYLLSYPLNIKGTQKCLYMGETKNSKATIPLKAMKNLSALSPHHSRALLPFTQPCSRPPPRASPSLHQPLEEHSRLSGLTQAVQVTNAKAPIDWLLWKMLNVSDPQPRNSSSQDGKQAMIMTPSDVELTILS